MSERPKPIINHYHHPGLTDLSVMKAQAEKAAEHGYTSWVHQHPRLNKCDQSCELYEPKSQPTSKKEN
jgi:hypothetical protein